MNKKILIFILSAFAYVAKAQPLKVGMELSYPPFEMTDAKNEPKGISVDIATALANYLHRPLEIVNMSFDGLIPSLKTGKIDLILSSMTVTDERLKSIDFSDAYVKAGLAILAGKNSSVQSAKDLDKKGIKVAVKKGTTGHIWATKNLHNAQVLVLDKENTAVLEVAQGKADAFLYDQMSIYHNWKQNPDKTRPILEAFQQEKWAVGLKKGQDKLKADVNAFLADFRKKGEFEKLGQKYFPEEKKTFESMGVGFIF